MRSGVEGLSVVDDWKHLPFFLIPARLKHLAPKARGADDLHCWTAGSGEFESAAIDDNLELILDKPTHGVLVPTFEMPFERFQSCLASTQTEWKIDEE